MPLLHITFHHPDFLRDDRYYPYLLEKYNFPRVPACSGYVLTEKLILVDLANTLLMTGPLSAQGSNKIDRSFLKPDLESGQKSDSDGL